MTTGYPWAAGQQVKAADLNKATIANCSCSGSANAYVLATAQGNLAAYYNGLQVSYKANFSNTGSATANIDGLGAVTIYKGLNTPLAPNDIQSGQIVDLTHDGTNFQIATSGLNLAFGGNGTDGALTSSSGTTTINCAGAAVVIKNYTSISLTGTAVLAFSNPHANGTVIILRSQGNVTLTSSATPAIDLRGMGAAGGTGAPNNNPSTGGSGSAGSVGNTSAFIPDAGVHGGGAGQGGVTANTTITAGTAGTAYSADPAALFTNTTQKLLRKGYVIGTGSGGGGGGSGCKGINDSSTSTYGGGGGNGGNGGGGLLIECGGALNFTCQVSYAGSNGTNGTNTNASASGGGGGGGGGSEGMAIFVYNTLTANTGTFVGGGGNGGNGGSGISGSANSTGASGAGGGGSFGIGAIGATANISTGSNGVAGGATTGGGGGGGSGCGGNATGAGGTGGTGGTTNANNHAVIAYIAL